MGGRVSVVNKTGNVIRVQLCQVSVLYSKVIRQNESWTQETGAVHFTVKIDVLEHEDILFGPELGLMRGRTKLFDSSEWDLLENYFRLSSPGWYFKGDNVLEIIGGPNFNELEFSGVPLKITRVVQKDISPARPENSGKGAKRNSVTQEESVFPVSTVNLTSRSKSEGARSRSESRNAGPDRSLDELFESFRSAH